MVWNSSNLLCPSMKLLHLSWDDNCRSGIAVARHHGQQGHHLRAKDQREGETSIHCTMVTLFCICNWSGVHERHIQVTSKNWPSADNAERSHLLVRHTETWSQTLPCKQTTKKMETRKALREHYQCPPILPAHLDLWPLETKQGKGKVPIG